MMALLVALIAVMKYQMRFVVSIAHIVAETTLTWRGGVKGRKNSGRRFARYAVNASMQKGKARFIAHVLASKKHTGKEQRRYSNPLCLILTKHYTVTLFRLVHLGRTG